MKANQSILWSILCIVMASICLSAQAAEWKLVAEGPTAGGPGGGGWINQLVIHPTKPDVLVAATEGAGVLISKDSGKTWIPKNEGLTEAAEGTVSGYHVRCLVIDPVKSGAMYIGMAAFGVFKTEDNGETWAPMNEMLGDTFTKVMTLHPDKSDVLYLGTDGGGIYQYKMASPEPEWEETIEGLQNTYIRALVMDPENPNVMYVGTNKAVSKSTDGGNTWAPAGNGLTSRYMLALAIDPKNTDVLYVGTDGGGLFKTEDSGDNWVAVGGEIWMTKSTADEFAMPGEEPQPVLLVSSVVVNPVNTAIVYAGNPSGVFRSADGGQTWEQINAGLSNTEVKCLTVSSAEPVTVYAGTADGKLFAYVEE
jgi:photosystem II stability/assembly factor-like uncharacterized protein